MSHLVVRRLSVVAASLLLLGCSPSPNPSDDESSQAYETMTQATYACLDLYANSEMDQAAIDAGKTLGVVVDEGDNTLHVVTQGDAFRTWLKAHPSVPWDDIQQSMLFGPGCPYSDQQPDVDGNANPDEREVKARDCLNTWVNLPVSQETIDSGVKYEVLTKESATGLFVVDINAMQFHNWLWDNSTIPWGYIHTMVVYGPGCPYR